jgi:PKD repeat protein
MRFFSFSAPYGIKQISPILFDASTSRGDGLTYFIEFGDREVAQTVTAVHPIKETGEYTAKLTAVDRFGRTDSETVPFEVRSLVADGYYYDWEGPGVLRIHTQEATAITGDVYLYSDREDGFRTFSGTANADGSVRWVLAGSAGTLVGTMTLWSPDHNSSLVLTYQGGPHDGETLKFYFRAGY